jgi:hypothetical protein
VLLLVLVRVSVLVVVRGLVAVWGYPQIVDSGSGGLCRLRSIDGEELFVFHRRYVAQG